MMFLLSFSFFCFFGCEEVIRDYLSIKPTEKVLLLATDLHSGRTCLWIGFWNTLYIPMPQRWLLGFFLQ